MVLSSSEALSGDYRFQRPFMFPEQKKMLFRAGGLVIVSREEDVEITVQSSFQFS